MSVKRRRWSQRELLIAFRLYCQTPFGRLHQRNPEIIRLSAVLGRTPGSVAMKACNFASLDPQVRSRGVNALGNVSQADRELWDEFVKDSERIAHEAEEAYTSITGDGDISLSESFIESNRAKWHAPSFEPEDVSGREESTDGTTENAAYRKVRRVQSFFRAAILASYGNRCALTGLAIEELLNASHIIPWSESEKRRADPRNGLCLNTLHDRAFDRGLISFDERLCVMTSPKIHLFQDCELHRRELVEIQGRPLRLPERFAPDPDTLKYHREKIFQC